MINKLLTWHKEYKLNKAKQRFAKAMAGFINDDLKKPSYARIFYGIKQK